MLSRWNVQEVYGMHNMPGIPLGHFALREGALMAIVAAVTIAIVVAASTATLGERRLTGVSFLLCPAPTWGAVWATLNASSRSPRAGSQPPTSVYRKWILVPDWFLMCQAGRG